MNKNETLERAHAQFEKCLGCKNYDPEDLEAHCLSSESQECQYDKFPTLWPDIYICDDAENSHDDGLIWILPGVQRSLTLTCVGYKRRHT